MTLHGTKEQIKEHPGFYSLLEKDLEEWFQPKKEKEIKDLQGIAKYKHRDFVKRNHYLKNNPNLRFGLKSFLD